MSKTKIINKEKIKWLFVDFFDTIVSRNCSPNDLKKKWAVSVVNELKLDMKPEKLYEARKAAEIELETRYGRASEFKYEDLSNELYARLLISSNNMDFINGEKFAEICLYYELVLEKESHRLNEDIVNILKQAVKDDVNVAVVSDFYLSKQYIKEFLDYQDISKYINRIFVSCDLNKNKRIGDIYRAVCDQLNIECAECLMIGDNRRSDYEIPKKLGIQAIHLKRNYVSDKISYEDKEKQLYEIYNEIDKDGYHYSSYAFLLFLYIYRLKNILESNNFEKVYFFAREGEFLKKLFDLYQKCDNSNNIKSEYLYVSRKATYVPTLKAFEDEKFDTIFREYPSIGIKSFLSSIGFDDKDIEDVSKELENKFKIDISLKTAYELIDYLIKAETFIKKYDENCLCQKDLFINYLKQQGITEDEKRIAIVDVGWKGTIQDNIYKIFDDKLSVFGYYIGLTGITENLDKNRKYGLIFSKYPVKSIDFDIWSYDKTFMERLLHASHPSTSGYEYNENNEIIPSMSEFKSEQGMYEKIKPIQDEICKCFIKIYDVFSDSYYNPEDFLSTFKQLHKKAIFKVIEEDLALQRYLRNGQFENFGYNSSFGENSKAAFSTKNMIKKVLADFRKLFSFSIVSSVLLQKKAYKLLKIMYRIKYTTIKNL